MNNIKKQHITIYRINHKAYLLFVCILITGATSIDIIEEVKEALTFS